MIETEPKYFFKYLKEKIGLRKNELKGDTRYFFIHLPKTAGTSFLFTLYDYFPYQQIYPHFQDYLNPNKKSYLNIQDFKKLKNQILTKDIKVISGHLPFHFRRYMGEDVKTLSFFRDPLKRVLSDVVYLKNNVEDFNDKTFEEVIAHNNYIIYRKQAHQFGFRPKRENILQAVWKVRHCDFVGITEQYERSIRLCNAIFGWNLKATVSKNKFAGNTKAKYSEFEHLIEPSRLAADNRVYQVALKRFELLCKEYGID